MTTYTAPIEDINFLIEDVLDFHSHYAKYLSYAEATPDMVEMIVTECAKFCETELAPLNQSGDKEGCQLKDGKVTTPKGFKESYQAYVDAGWQGISHPIEYGGQGLPPSLGLIRSEMLGTANWSWSMYPGLSLGAMDTVIKHGSQSQKEIYLPKLTEGVWSGTMCLTEAQCGSDLGRISTKAEPQKDGSYSITGSKIFISAGDHDLTENIIHIVLARLPDAPKGTRGISLFVVPKILVNEDSTLGEANAVSCGTLEEKMGIKASSTVTLNFDAAKGFLIGEENKGLEYMFTYMNNARLGTALQGVSSAELAYQISLPYVKERLSMRSLTGKKFPEKEADPIIVHPDVRKMLLTQKAISEGGRAMIYYAAKVLDELEQCEDEQASKALDEKLGFLTPILKGFLTELGFESANLGIQVLGGYGYTKEWGLEQIVRDTRVSTLYEGTTGIQALDLLGRKMLMERGKTLRSFANEIMGFCKGHSLISGNPHKLRMNKFIWPLTKAVFNWQRYSLQIASRAQKDRDLIGSASVEYLMYSGYITMAYLWAMMAQKANEEIAKKPENIDFYRAKVRTAEFYFERIFPRIKTLGKTMMAKPRSLMRITSDQF
ncbi:MAG: acyl-CoA dehydrogenase C-terminal domain-containing protein [Woeseiaceae bacterium]|nr:acyl-CoA dehydrogenase C-terminal domain-containing protein [Woeseiaceae bacterium]MDX2608539.1 acyl-CoA dehydrogenase C-terminal domain-containing protein [Woeseiaceae bacterium]